MYPRLLYQSQCKFSVDVTAGMRSEQGMALNPLLQHPCASFPHDLISARARANSAGGR
jgi:hypothetical protein